MGDPELGFIGVDPGKSGGISIVFPEAPPEAYKTPSTERDLLDLMVSLSARARFGCIEHVHSMPKQGVVSAFTFGAQYGGLRMSMVAANLPFERVTPRVWQSAMKCLSKGDKNVTKARAQELFPSLKITHAIADSLLIAEYCRRTYKRH